MRFESEAMPNYVGAN